MKLGVLFSGGKDSTLATLIAKENGYKIECFISIISDDKHSYMFHTPSISKTETQAKSIEIPIIIQKTKGEKEKELEDLEKAIKIAKEKYKIEGIVTGAVESVYQASRIQKICDKLNLECFNPLWQKNQFEILDELIKRKFEVIITGVFAFPFDSKWLGRKIDKNFVEDVRKLNKKYQINPAGEGGEYESFVLYAPKLFRKKLKIKDAKIKGKDNSWSMEVEVE